MSQDRLDISLIVCTYNRADSLRRTLESIAHIKVLSACRWEVIVVDNNSSDMTRQVVADVCHLFPNLPLRYLFEAKQGLSHARNTGIDAAVGDYIFFTDDDVLPDADWLLELYRGMQEYGCDAAGGYIAPIWEVSPPDWLTPRFYGMLALKVDVSGPYRVEQHQQYPYGANMAFKRSVFERIGLFNTELGRKGKVLAAGEEYDLLDRLRESGGEVVYFPKARVSHHIEAFRVSKRYFRRWKYQQSRNMAEVEGAEGRYRFFSVPLYLYFYCVRGVYRAIMSRLFDSSDEAFFRELMVWYFLGMIAGIFRHSRNHG